MNTALRNAGGRPGDVKYFWRSNGRTYLWTADGGRGYKPPMQSPADRLDLAADLEAQEEGQAQNRVAAAKAFEAYEAAQDEISQVNAATRAYSFIEALEDEF